MGDSKLAAVSDLKARVIGKVGHGQDAGSKPKDDGLNNLPDRVRSAVRAYMRVDASCEKSVWARAEKAYCVKVACDAKHEDESKPTKWPSITDVAKRMGESKASFYDDLNAWEVRIISDLTNRDLPPKGYSSFVSLGRLLKSAKNLVLANSNSEQPMEDSDVEQAVAPVTEMIKVAANQFALKLGKQAIRDLVKKKPRELLGYPEDDNSPSSTEPEMAIDDRKGIPTTGEDLASEINRRCSSPDYEGRGCVMYVGVGLSEMDGSSVAQALASPTLQAKAVSAVKNGMDLWLCFRQRSHGNNVVSLPLELERAA